MSDEKNNQSLENEGVEETNAVPEEKAVESDAEALNEELENLRDTFQEKYDETVEEANSEPVIQELEEGEEEEDAPEEEEEEEISEIQTEKAPKKKKKTGKALAIALPITILVFIICVLGAYVVASMTNPNFSAFISTYAKATAAETYDDKVTYLEEAIEYCADSESAFQTAMKSTLQEELAVAVYENEGFSSAYSYISSEMSAEQIANPVNSKFKKIVKILDSIEEFAVNCFGQTFINVADSKEVPSYEELVKGLDVPSEVEETAADILNAIAEGYILNKAGSGVTDALTAMNYYADAYSGLMSLGAPSRKLAESIVETLYDNGFVIEAAAFASVTIDPEAEIERKSFEDVKDAIASYSEVSIDVLALAAAAINDEKTDKEAVLSAVKAVEGMTEDKAEVFADIVLYAIDSIKAQQNNNLTEASTCYATLTSVLEAFSISDVKVNLRTAEVIFNSGNLTDAKTLVETYLTEEALEAATAEQKASVEKMQSAFTALSNASEVFSPFYSEYYQMGTAMDYDEVSAELDSLIGEDATAYDKGFVAYFKYFTATSSAETTVDTMALLDEMDENIPDLPFVYGYFYIDEYLLDDNYAEAKAYAEKLLAINVADEYANSIIALCKRVEGDVEGSLEAALKGIELSGESSYCGTHAAIAYMLKGDFESAFGYLSTLVNTTQSLDTYDLMLVFNALYEGGNEELEAELATLVDTIEQTYSYYQVVSYDDTTALIEGTKTLEDVFLDGNYDLS